MRLCHLCCLLFSPQVGAASEEESESDGWGDDSDSDAEEEGGEGGASKEEGEGGGDGNTTGGEGGGGGKKEGGKKKERGAGGDYDYFDDFIDDEGGCWCMGVPIVCGMQGPLPCCTQLLVHTLCCLHTLCKWAASAILPAPQSSWSCWSTTSASPSTPASSSARWVGACGRAE